MQIPGHLSSQGGKRDLRNAGPAWLMGLPAPEKLINDSRKLIKIGVL